MALLDIKATRKITATVTIEEATATLVDHYADFLKVSADDVVNKALEYVFSKDRDFQQHREQQGDIKAPEALRVVKKPAPAPTAVKRGRKPALAIAN